MTWLTKKLGEVCEIVTGSTPRTSVIDYYGGDILWAGPTDLDQGEYVIDTQKKLTKRGITEGGARLVPKNSVMVGCIGNIGKVAITSEEMATNQQINTFFPRIKDMDSKYLFYALVFKSDEFRKLSSQTTLPIINKSKCSNIEIPLPPLEVQKKIVAKLERVLAKIGEAKKLRAEARENTDNLLSAELHKIFSQQDSYSLIRANKRIVKEWEEKELGEICEINPKKSELKNEPDDLLVSFVPMKAIDEFSQEITSFDEKKLEEVRKGYTYFRGGDVLFAKITPCMENGKVAIARNLKNSIGFGTTEFHVIRPREGVLPEWIYAIIRHPEFRNVAKTKMTGSAGQKRVPVQFLENYKIPLPPLAEQKKIVARLDSLSEKIEKIKNLQSQTAADFKTLEQSILHQAFSN